MEFAVSDRLDLGLLGNFSYKVIGGTFLDNSNMTFIDYRHFNGNETFFLRNFASETPYNIFRNGLNRLNALPYYSSSTNGAFAQFHIEQDFSNWLTNKITLLRLARLQTLIG